jgi:hypothetical protein
MKKIHFVYKTVHDDGFFYIGRHSTTNINDGYLGSGIWVSRATKSKLKREILAYANSFDDLVKLEEKLILENFDDELCMNMKLASIGWTPEDAKLVVKKQIEDGKNALTNGRSIKRNIVNDSARKKAAETIKNMFIEGTHPLGGDLARERIKEQIVLGTHPGSIVFSKIHTCPHCDKTGKGAIMFRHHFDNCKKYKNVKKA